MLQSLNANRTFHTSWILGDTENLQYGILLLKQLMNSWQYGPGAVIKCKIIFVSKNLDYCDFVIFIIKSIPRYSDRC